MSENYAAMGLPAELGKTAFDWQRTPEEKPLTSVDKNRIASAQRYRDNKIKLATRVNPNTYNPTTQTDADKRARLMGHSFNGAAL